MSTTEMLVQLKEILGYPLFTVSNVNINTATILVFVLLIGTAVVVSWLVRKAIRRSFYARGVTADGTIGATNRLAHYAVMLIGIGIALDTVGINLNALFAAGAIFAVAIGFAMRNIVENFISGIILLVERVLKPGDVIDVDGQRVKIVDMRIRTTVGRTRDGGAQPHRVAGGGAFSLMRGDWKIVSRLAQVEHATRQGMTQIRGSYFDGEPKFWRGP
ncbi:MAG: mechanosensitive ion channel [Candidatus Krumholzibacteriota bacterium]|nr:mechanosensitive ion channel [Candidatus Krumholzibacteriota bacterium]